jgi:hypothetical protein
VDKLAHLDPASRQYVEAIEAMTPDEKAALAREYVALKNKPAEKPPETKPEPPKPLTGEDKVDLLIKRFDAMEAEKKAEKEQRERAEMHARDLKQFEDQLSSVLSEYPDLKDDKDFCDSFYDAAVGHCIRTKPANQRTAIKALLDRNLKKVEELADKRKEEYLKGKIGAAKQTRGETKPGTPPAKQENKGNGKDFFSREAWKKFGDRVLK